MLRIHVADTRSMQYTQATQVRSLADSVDVVSSGTGRFTQGFAVVAAAIYSLLAASMMIVEPEVARFSLIWVLWAVVIVVATATYAAGRYVRRRSL